MHVWGVGCRVQLWGTGVGLRARQVRAARSRYIPEAESFPVHLTNNTPCPRTACLPHPPVLPSRPLIVLVHLPLLIALPLCLLPPALTLARLPRATRSIPAANRSSASRTCRGRGKERVVCVCVCVSESICMASVGTYWARSHTILDVAQSGEARITWEPVWSICGCLTGTAWF